MSIYEAKVLVDGLVFRGHSYHGAIDVYNSNVEIRNSEICHNYPWYDRSMGIINLLGGSTICLYNTHIYNNLGFLNNSRFYDVPQKPNKLIIDNCLIENNYVLYGNGFLHTNKTDVTIKNSCIRNNFDDNFYSRGFSCVKDGGSLNVYNTTFINNRFNFNNITSSLCWVEESETACFENCTIISYPELNKGTGSTPLFHGNVTLKNNIIVTHYNDLATTSGKFVTSGNIFSDFKTTRSNIKDYHDFSNDIIFDGDFSYLLDGKTEGEAFIPNLTNNGGLTPTVKLLKDVLPNGSPIRIPLSETVVTTDQRGVTREDPTCPGAYELMYEAPKNYYVKVNGSGDKSGVNWKHAMSFADFCTLLPDVPDGTTFHFAEGNYGKDGYYKGGLTIKSSVKIIGGYPETDEEDVKKVKSDPTNYSTAFKETGNVGYASFFYLNGKEKDIEFHNVDFYNTYINEYEEFKSLTIDSCQFFRTPLDIRGENLVVRNTYMKGNLQTKYFTNSGQIQFQGITTTIENCTFECEQDVHNSNLSISINGNGSVRNCTFYRVYPTSTSSILLNSTSGKLEFFNNTVVGKYPDKIVDQIFSFNENVDFVGNIFVAAGNRDNYGTIEKLSVNTNNLLGFESKSATNKYVSDFSKIMEGTVTDGVFMPTLAYNGGYTPTVKLISDRSSGTSIRFDRKETGLTTDQRGIKREDLTCPGSYELLASESINRDATDYYVSTTGTGNGSDWKNAMSFGTFAEFVPEANKGVTFHFAAGEYTYDKDITIAKDVTLMGGYSASPSATDEPSSCGTKTIFSLNSKLEFGNGLKKVDIKNISFGEKVGINIPTSDNYNLVLNINNCTLYALSVENAKEIYIKNSTLLTNVSNVIDVYAQATFVESCFINSEGLIIHDHFKFRSYSNTTIRNSTIKGSSADVVLFSYGNVYFYNNTVCHAPYQIKDVYTKISLEGERAVIVGNILNTKGFSYIASKGETVSNNVVFGTNNSFDAENNIIVNASDFDGFVEGKVSGSGFSFSPADNGGCTKTVKLLSSYITDDKTYVRYPKSVYYISEDQRGEKRMDFLCPGSYEIPYEVVEYAGSICRGEKYEDNGFEIDSRDSLGGDYDYYWYEEAKVNKLHTLHLNITPKSCSIDVTAKEFYVKQKGTGNGSSWKNAMSPEDFAGMIPYAVEGATFHIAAGEYDFYKLTNGIYVEKERYGYNYYGRYTWQNKVNLIGGYPADAEDIATSSDPENNPTIFTNSYFCEKNHANSYLDVKLGNVHNITFSNFSLQNPTLVDSCTFKSDFACLNLKPGSLASHNAISYSSKNGTANIKNSSFSGDYQNTISCGYVDELVIEGCTFESITTTDIVSGTSGVVKAYNNSFVNNDCYYTFDRNSKEYLVNNTFINASYVSEEYTVFTGNILVDTELEESEEATITNNLVSGTFGIKGTNDKVIEKSALATIIDGTYDKATGKFTPNLKDNGGYTKTVAIVGDVLPDGKTSIRFKQSTLTTDQRGEKRLDPTCPGAYEYLDGIEKLEFVGKPLVEDNSCSTPNSKVTIKVSGWTQDCFAKTTLANRFDNEEKPVSVKDGVAVFEFKNLGGAKYVFTATNNINSTITYPFEIRTIEAPTITFLSYSSSSSVSCKGSTDANADLVLKGGNEKNYTFTVDNKQNKFFINNKTTVSDLGEGTHVFVYSSNVAGCDDKDEYIYDVKVYDKLEVEGIGLDINCASSKGQAEIKITDGFKTYDVTLTDKAGNEIKKNTSENEFVIEGLTPGVEYTLKVVDKYECESTFEKPIVSKMLAAKPSIVRTAEILALKCAGDKNGSATYTVSGGNSNYGLRVNGGGWLTAQKDGSYLIGNLTAGTYKVEYASKTGDCADVAKDEFTVSEPQALVVEAEASTIRCANEDATVTVSTMGGTKPYSIVLTPKDGENVTVSSSNAITEISGLTAGVSYTVAVTDKNGCKVTYDETIIVNKPSSMNLTASIAGAICAEVGGSITIEVEGGIKPYTYQWSDAKGVMTEVSNKATGLKPEQEYAVKVTDANGCSVENKNIEMTWETATDLEISSLVPTAIDQTCYGVNNGQIKATVVTDANTANLKMIVENVTTGKRKDGFADAAGVFLVDSLAPGDYNVYIDYNNEECPTTTSAVKAKEVVTIGTVKAQFAIDKKNVVAKQPNCYNEPNGEVEFKILNWNENYEASLLVDGKVSGKTIKPEVKSTDPTSAYVSASGLNGGLYALAVNNGCKYGDTLKYALNSAKAPKITEVSADSVLACNDSLGSVRLTFTEGHPTTSVIYVEGGKEISLKGDTTIVFDKLTSGAYAIHYKNMAEGCTDDAVYTMNVKQASEPFEMAVALVGDICTEQKIVATVSGGAKPYASTVWADADTELSVESASYETLTGVGEGSYYLTIVDANDCKYVSDTIKANLVGSSSQLGNVVMTVDSVDNVCYGNKEGQIRVKVSDNDSKLKLKVSVAGAGYKADTTIADVKADISFTEVPAGTYTVTLVSDNATACEDGGSKLTKTVTVNQPGEIKVTPIVAGVICAEVGGSITLEVNGGTDPYTYQWMVGDSILAETTNKADGLQPENEYSVKVTDANGCFVEKANIKMPWETVKELEILSIVPSAVGQTCYGVNNGQIKAAVKTNANTASLKLIAENVATGAIKSGLADVAGNFLIDSLTPGDYNIYLDYNAGECPTSNSAVKVDDVLTVSAIDAQFAIDKEYVVAEQPTCFTEPNGKVAFKVLNWNKNYNVSIKRNGVAYGNNANVALNADDATVALVSAMGQQGGLHRMVVSDACGNKDSIDATLTAVDMPLITEVSADSVLLCNYSTTGVVELNFKSSNPKNMLVSMSGAEETIKMSADTTIKFENLAIGHYDIYFKSTDAACTDADVYTVTVKPESEFSMKLDLEGDACTEQKINATVTGGAKPYASAVWTKADNNMVIEGAPIETLEGVGVGSFFLKVVDANACEYTSDTIQTNLVAMTDGLGDITMTVDGVDNTCYGLSEGQLIVNIDGNNYNNELNISVAGSNTRLDSVVSIAEGSVVFDKLAAGEYKVTLTYAGAIACDNGAGTINVTKSVLQPAELKVVPSQNSPICEEEGGSINLTAKGGVEPYTYVWSDANGVMNITDNKADKLALGTYNCKVTDANNCEVETGEMTVQLATLASLDKVNVDAKAIGQKCYGVPNGVIETKVNATGYQYQFKLIASNDDAKVTKTVVVEDGKAVFNNLEPGDYKLTLDYDFEQCPSTRYARLVDEKNVAKISAPLAIDKDYQESVDPTCYNEPNGKAVIKVSNWSEFYTASAFQNGVKLNAPVKEEQEGAMFFTSSGLSAHVEMAIADICGNSDTMKYDLKPLTKPEVKLIDSYTTLKCSYSTDGYLKYSISGGHPETYKVELTGNKFAQTFDYAETVLAENLGANNYTFAYKSTLAGCTDNANHKQSVTVPQPIMLYTAVSPLVCNEEATGEFSFVPYRGGTFDKIKYDSIDNSKNYAVEIYKEDDSAIAEAFSELKSLRITAKSQDAATLKDALIQAIIPDEDKPDSLAPKDFPLKKFWKDSIGYIVPKAWIGFDMLPADVYYITTVDNNNCQFVDSIIIDKTPTYNTLVFNSVEFDAAAAACQSSKRRIEIRVSGGWGDYAYSIADLRDVNADEDSQTSAGGVAMLDTTAASDSTFEADGVGYYRSAILEPGTYQITVTDGHGCMQTYESDIEVKANMVVDGEVIMDKCDPTAANVISAFTTSANGYQAAAPYTFMATYDDQKIEGSSPDGKVTVDNIPNAVVGILVVDANNCEGFKSFPVPRNDSIEILTLKKEEVLDNKCYEDMTGAVVFKLFGGNPAYTHFILDEDTLSHDENIMLAVVNKEVTDRRIKLSDLDLNKSDMTNLFCMTNMHSGDHKLTITDSAGCAASIEFSLSQPELLQVVASATGVCPGKREGEAMGRIYPELVSGGVKPYKYALDYNDASGDIFSSKDHIDAREGVEHVFFVQDANGCIANSEPQKVVGEFDAGALDQRCLLSTWQGLGDVLVVTDVTNYSTLKAGVKLDSTVIEMKELPKGVTCQQEENVLYLYGIPDSIASIEWCGETISGPLWGIPSDIAAGVKTDAEYQKLKKQLDEQKNNAQKQFDAVMAKLNNRNILSESDINKLLADSAAYSDTLASVKMRERTNCTLDMIKNSFLPLTDEETSKRMTFWKMSSISKLEVDDFTYDFSMTSYLNGCTMSVDYNDMGVDLKDPNSHYVRFNQKDILGLRCAPNPVAYNGRTTVNVTLGNKIGYTYRVYDFQGQVISDIVEVKADQLEVLTDEDSNESYKSSFDLENISSPCIVTVSTGSDVASVIVLVKGGSN